jgi:hypothetical protein
VGLSKSEIQNRILFLFLFFVFEKKGSGLPFLKRLLRRKGRLCEGEGKGRQSLVTKTRRHRLVDKNEAGDRHTTSENV